AAGFTIPKTSSRAITSPAGTADTMECLAKVEMSEKKIRSVVKKTKACIVHGGSMHLAPADDKIIEVEHPLSIDAEGQLLASVMAKKFSVSANHVLIDIPMGPEVKAKTKKEAKHLKKMFELIGRKLGMDVRVILSDGTQPIGNGIGPLLEAEDVMSVLRNDPLAPQDLRDKSVVMAGILLEMAGKRNGRKVAIEILNSGKALQKMNEIIKAQGKQKQVLLGQQRYKVRASKRGTITSISNNIIAKVARIAGAPTDKGAGLFLTKRRLEKVRKGDVLYTIYAHSEFKLQLAKEFVRKNKGFTII
ncbi:TPA: thymidine phosphorylase, partial [Candidatus Woesearchaeota archaeon]|nr:thymidine phosphorylase [Candidatus Woesearchaeota archaeon]